MYANLRVVFVLLVALSLLNGCGRNRGNEGNADDPANAVKDVSPADLDKINSELPPGQAIAR